MHREHCLVGRYLIHGLAVEVSCACVELAFEVQHVLGPFAETALPENFSTVSGTIVPFESSDVVRHMSPGATLIEEAGCLELYADGERFWLVDDRWGICEINVLKNQWRSWILPRLQVDPFSCVEQSVLWPMAQLLRNKGLHLVPAASVSRDGWSGLILSRGDIGRELRALADERFNVIGQRWTALREDENRVSLLHLPGLVENTPAQRRRGASHDSLPRWIDLMAQYPQAHQHHAFCDGILIIEPGRRPRGRIGECSPINAIHALRRNWPIVELHPDARRRGRMAARLAQACRCYEVQLSREAGDLARMIDSIQSLNLTPWMESPTRLSVNPLIASAGVPLARAS